MLPEEEQTGARQLLQMLADDDLFPLANTTAKRRIVIRSRAGKVLDDYCCWYTAEVYLSEASWLQMIYEVDNLPAGLWSLLGLMLGLIL